MSRKRTPGRRKPINSPPVPRPTVAEAHAERNVALRENLKRRGEEGDEFAELLAGAAVAEIVNDEVLVRGEMSEEQHRRLLDLAGEAADSYKERCQTLINRLMADVSGLNPLPLIAQVFALNAIQIGDYFEPTSHQSEARIEFAVALLASVDLSGTTPDDPDWNQIGNFLDELYEIFELARLGNIARSLSEQQAGEAEAEIRFDAVSRHLAVRGMCYPQHGVDLAEELYGGLSEVMRARLGFDARDVAQFARATSAECERRFNDLAETAGIEAERLLERARTDPELEGLLNASSPEEAFAHAAGWILFSNLQETLVFSVDDAARWTGLTDDQVRSILNEFSVDLGLGAYEKPHPMKVSPAMRYPIVRYEDQYLLALAGRMERELALLLDKPVRPIAPRLSRRKDRVVTALTLEYLTSMLPGAQSFASLHYRVVEEGLEKRVEMDGLVTFDRCLFLIEGKPGALSPQAESGSDMARLLGEIEDNAVRALQQGQRARRYISSQETAPFEDESGQPLIEIRRNQYDHIFIVTPTLYSLGEHGPQLSRLRAVGMFEEGEYPFSVYINDLRVIAESVLNPIEFIHYLRWRERLPLGERVRAADELDLFGTFLLREQYARRLATSVDWVSAVGSTTDFDDYYLEMPEGKRRKDPPRMFHKVTALRHFVDSLAAERPEHWLDAGGVGLEFSLAELAVLDHMLKRLPNVNPGHATMQTVTSAEVDDALDPIEVSLGLVVLGKGVEWSEAWLDMQRDLEGIHRVVFCRRSSRGNPLIVWALQAEQYVLP